MRIPVVGTLLVALIAASTLTAAALPRDELPRELLSPPGQVVVLTVNARIGRVLDEYRFRRMLALVEAIRSRPDSFEGGTRGAVATPDIIMLQEVSGSNLEIFRRVLNQNSRFSYEIVSTNDSVRGLLVNTDALTLEGDPQSWANPCLNPNKGESRYVRARFREIATGATLTAANVHFPRTDPEGESNCTLRNVEEMRVQLADEPLPIIVGGDFNRRPVVEKRECDPHELSTPRNWYNAMTAPSDGSVPFTDSVRSYNRRRGISMEYEWSHEWWQGPKVLCDGSRGFNRSRIDYLFGAGTVIAEAHADHPGWAGVRPRERNPDNYRYSDHRFVWGRFVFAGPQRVPPPTARAQRRGRINLAWETVEGSTGYVVYRAVGGKDYVRVGRVAADVMSYVDGETEHAKIYRYSIAPVDAVGAQGLESRPAYARADSRGPVVVRITPRPGAINVSRRPRIEVRFNERAAAASVRRHTIELRRKGNRVAGITVQRSGRLLTLRPKRRIAKGKWFHVIVHATQDRLGNVGSRFTSTFRT